MRLKDIKPGMVIHCKTEEEAKELMLHLESKGLTWGTGENPTCNNRFSILGGFTCYKIHEGYLTFDCYSHFESSNSKITEFSDLIIPELSAKEVLEALHDMCQFYNSEGRQCDDCPADPYCVSMSFKDGMDSFLDACTKWREEHPKEKKKELETEWVYVVRIIKVHDNGKKECVHEVDAFASSDDVDSPFSESEELAERELKDYVANHEGNFFATLEHICRIKE